MPTKGKDLLVSDNKDDWEVTTYYVEKRASFKWRIENFSHWPIEGCRKIRSPAYECCSSKWVLELYPDGELPEDKGNVRLYLTQLFPNAERKVEYRMCLKDHNGVNHSVRSGICVFGAAVSKSGLKIIDRKTLVEEKRDELLCNDTLTLYCEVIMRERIDGKVESVHESSSNKKDTAESGLPKSIKIFLDDIENLWKEKKNCDVTLQVGEKKFPAHKLLLRARSKVFAAMFEHDMVENISNIITITDIESDVVNDLLHFIYSGYIKDMSVDKAIGLYPAADKYALLDLKTECADFLRRNLSADSICNIAMMADAHNDGIIIDSIKMFIHKNRSVLSSEEWRRLVEQNPRLAYEITIPITIESHKN